MSGRIAICGAVAQKPNQAGHTWQFLQYLLGFRQLGWDVLLVDRLHGEVAAADPRVEYLRTTMREAGLDGSWTLALDDGTHAGLPRGRALRWIGEADLLLNLMGFCTDPEVLDRARLRVFLDTDPGFGQMWRELGLADVFAGHDRHVTIGERIGAADCTIPVCGIDWVTTPQPVVLSAWPRTEPPHGPPRFPSVASWRGAYGPVDLDGRRYGLRVHQFRRFAELPGRTACRLEVALDIDRADGGDARTLERAGWTLVDPAAVAATPSSYRRYVQGSSAELVVAKGMYVDTRGGWISERSLCYLASGRPVLAQATGFEELYPVGRGLLAFSTLVVAVAGIEAVAADHRGQSAAAYEVAREHFGSDRVLGTLLDRLGAPVPA
jgi:hypothetical protein